MVWYRNRRRHTHILWMYEQKVVKTKDEICRRRTKQLHGIVKKIAYSVCVLRRGWERREEDKMSGGRGIKRKWKERKREENQNLHHTHTDTLSLVHT